MMRVIKRVLPALALALAMSASAAGAHQEAEPWPDLFISVPLGGHWLASGEVIERVSANDDRFSQTEARAQIGYALSKRVTVWAGYVRYMTDNKGRRDGLENQAVEQLNWNAGTIGPVRVALRTRVEERFIRGVDPVTWRVREQLRLVLPLAPRGASAVVWTEPFVGLNHTVARDTLEQLRSFAGVSLPVTKHAEVEIGYLSQDFFRQGKNVHNDTIPLIVNVRF